MKKVGIGISLFLNVILLVGLVFVHQYDVSHATKCKDNKEEPVPVEKNTNTVICVKSETKDEGMDVIDTVSSRTVMEYSNDGIITSMKNGTIIKYKDEEFYQKTLKESSEKLYEEMGNLELYFYSNADVKVKLEDGTTQDSWVIDYIQTLKQNGYTCE